MITGFLGTFLGFLMLSGSSAHSNSLERSTLPGATGYTSVEIPRVEGVELVLDGALSEDVWARAKLFTNFYQSRPFDDRPAQDSTHVLVWYSPTAIYVGIRAFSPHGDVRATLADRDKIQGDDYVQILLDTYNDQRQAYMFGVNALGQQADGVVRDSQDGERDSQGGSRFVVDFSPDFVYESSGRLTDYGYELEIMIPFKSLRFQSDLVQNWGFNVVRLSQHSGYESTMTRVLQSGSSFLSQGATLSGLTDMRRGLVLDITPEITASANRGLEGSKFDTETRDPLGMNLRWGVSNNLTVNATFNPDFSQVEADVAQVVYDPRQAVFFPEKRPYFLDGIEVFQSPARLVYTRRIANPLSSIKLSGKLGKTNIGVLSAIDNKAISISELDPTYYNIVRLNHDLKGQNSIGLTYTDKMESNHSNRVAALDGKFFFSDYYSMTWQAGLSRTSYFDEVRTAPMWQFSAVANSQKYTASLTSTGFHSDFRAESGFISRIGIARIRARASRKFFGEEGDFLENYSLGLSAWGTWNYDQFVDGHGANDRQLHFNSTFRVRGGWNVRLSMFYESFKYPESLYTNYYIEQQVNTTPVDTVSYTGTDRLTNLGIYTTIQTPSWKIFSASTRITYARDDNFFEWAPADIYFITLDLNINPTEQLRLNLLYTHQQYVRANDKSTVGNHRFPRLKAEYQITSALFVRVVGQYDSRFVDDLRDNSRTEDPILIQNPDTGTFRRALAVTSNRLQVDWLISYRPTPGTVLFLGYGSRQTETNTFRFGDLQRESDGFFMKLSYLFRV